MTDSRPAPRRRRGRAGLFAPFILILIAFAAWSGWWVWLSRQVDAQVETRVAALQQAGWTVERERTGVTGWPFRLKLDTGAMRIAAPSGHAVAAPAFAAQASALNPGKWVMVASDGLTLTRAAKGDVDITARAIRMSVHGLTQRFPNVALELAEPVFAARTGAEPFPLASAGKVELYLRPHLAPAGSPGAEDSVDVLFRLLDGVGRPGGPIEGLAQNGRLTIQAETVIARADRIRGADAAGVLSAWSRDGGRFSALKGEMTAGRSRARLVSEGLSADRDGRLTGVIDLDAVNPYPALAGLVQASQGQAGGGGVNPLGAAAAAAAAAGPAGPAGAPADDGQSEVKLTLTFRDGRAWLGPFPLAPAPKLF
ncbi:DUF2125 domain-containing protein [Brevundimonas sp. VNH65]|uniref:DUF2125 domain-containing protein n=1 Tax=Brevundimonas sp. VNH65 TaxID=3400917 RepID=UPI003C0BBB1E